MSGKVKPVADLKEEQLTIYVVFASSVPQDTMTHNGANNRLLVMTLGIEFSNGSWPDPANKTWQMRTATHTSKGSPEYIVIGAPFWGAEHFAGDIAEMLVYPGDLPAVQKAQVQLYLNAKYKLN